MMFEKKLLQSGESEDIILSRVQENDFILR